MRELIFLTLANHLPRLKLCDRFRWRLYKWAGMHIEGPCAIWGPLTIRPIGGAKNIHIAGKSFLNTETRFGVPSAPVKIGANVQIGPRVSFETVNHDPVAIEGQKRGIEASPITIEDNVWIGANVVILGGVTIGQGAVVAAGAVVNKDVAPNTTVGGVPAKPLKTQA